MTNFIMKKYKYIGRTELYKRLSIASSDGRRVSVSEVLNYIATGHVIDVSISIAPVFIVINLSLILSVVTSKQCYSFYFILVVENLIIYTMYIYNNSWEEYAKLLYKYSERVRIKSFTMLHMYIFSAAGSILGCALIFASVNTICNASNDLLLIERFSINDLLLFCLSPFQAAMFIGFLHAFFKSKRIIKMALGNDGGINDFTRK